MSYGVGYRRGLDPALLWLWRRPVATAPIQPLAWEPPYAAGVALEKAKKKKKIAKTDSQYSITCWLFSTHLIVQMAFPGESIQGVLDSILIASVIS